ncbi:hypothetical protein DPEC_G00317690 [Dallia pectoralis]|uniref:Uncharacterized protein n=1 Tax=Dallia pectoralis TaxID=75939 RepID=A0ACC2FDC7_DALPE|nr:hypothetical protein DPEC_G00317690 [Dallia pectoralis]
MKREPVQGSILGASQKAFILPLCQHCDWPHPYHPKHCRSLHDHKDDLRKRLSYTTHKLEMVESEFDSTRQYLETELRRAQEELEKFSDKLRRIQSSYAAQQRINQDLEDTVHRTSQHHEDEKRALSREIIVLNNHLLEAKITIEKLKEDNDLYRKDCNLAAQLLQCSKSYNRANKLSELPVDFQERVSSHIEKHGRGITMAMCHSQYSDSVPTTVIANVLQKPEPGNSCPVTRSPSPQPPENKSPGLDNSLGQGGAETLQRRAAYRTSDLYCSDTALYCPERWQERRQSADVHGGPADLLIIQAQNSTDSNPEEDFHSGDYSQHGLPSFHGEFAVGSLRAASSYSSFSQASEEERGGEGVGGTLSSSHQALYIDWQDGGYGERRSSSSYDKDSPPCPSVFPKSRSFQHVAAPPSPNRAKASGSSPAYTRTASGGYSKGYHSPCPVLAHSTGSAQGGTRTSGVERSDSQGSMGSLGTPTEEELTGRWRQLSVEDMDSFSRNPGRVSPYIFSEQHFAVGPAKAKLGHLYSSFQEGDDDNVFLNSRAMDHCLAAAAAGGGLSPSLSPSPSPKHPSLGLRSQMDKPPPLYRAKVDSQDSECSLPFLLESFKDQEGGVADVSRDSSAESLQHPRSLEASTLEQHHPRSLEASTLEQHHPRSLEASTLEQHRPRSLETSAVQHHPRSLETSSVPQHHPRSLEPCGPQQHHPRSLETSSVQQHHPRSLETSSVHHHHHQRARERPGQSPALPKKSSKQYQKFGSTGTGLSRKDSLTKAQLYGTLLN